MVPRSRITRAFLALALASTAHADVLCIKSSGSTRSIKIRAGGACGSKETALVTLDALQTLLSSISSTASSNGTLRLSNVEIVSPIDTPPEALRARAVTPPVGGTLHYCVGPQFPGELTTQLACANPNDCNHICVRGED